MDFFLSWPVHKLKAKGIRNVRKSKLFRLLQRTLL